MQSKDVFLFPCPACGKEQEAERGWSGLEGECHACGHGFMIPKTAMERIIPFKQATVAPPAAIYNFAERLLDRVLRGKYSRSKNSLDDRIREHVHTLVRDSQDIVKKYQHKLKQIEADRDRFWTDLRENHVSNSLRAHPVRELLQLDGVGKGTLEKLECIGLDNIYDVSRSLARINTLDRISQLAQESIETFCQRLRQEAVSTFYPVFTDKDDASAEMKLLRTCLEIEAAKGCLLSMEAANSTLRGIHQTLPRYTWRDRVSAPAAFSVGPTTKEKYETGLRKYAEVKRLGSSSRTNMALNQDEYIRAIGILDRVHPRPTRDTGVWGTRPPPGAPDLSKLKGFTSEEKSRHAHVGEKERDRQSKAYDESEALLRFGGTLALKILSNPREQSLIDEIESQPLDEGLLKDIVLRNYQRFGAKFILSRKRVVLGDEMGLGKTIQALAVMSHLSIQAEARGEKVRCMIICPASIRINWEREITRFTNFPVLTVTGRIGMGQFQKWQADGGIVVISYESLKNFPKTGLPPDLCIVDEAQYVKNPKSQRTRNTRSFLQDAKCAVCMTGTPIENCLEEFLEIFAGVRQALDSELRALLLQDETPENFVKLVQSVYLRRNKQDVLVELPPLNLIHEQVELTDEELEQHLEDIQDDGVHFMQIRQNLNRPDRSGSSKMKRVMTLVREYQENKRNVIVFTYFLEPLNWFLQHIPDTYLIEGRVSHAQRQQQLDEFSRPLGPSEKGRLLCAQIKSGGVGLNIQAASAVILLEPQFNPAVETQAISRVHRMGQRRSVDVHRMISVGTIEEILLERLYAKQEIMDLYAGDSHLKHLSPAAVDRDTLPANMDERDLRRVLLQKYH